MNCNDMLLSMGRKTIEKEKKKLEKEKDELIKRQVIVSSAMDIVKTGGPTIVKDLKTCIQWKTNKNAQGLKAELEQRWDACKDAVLPPEKLWTPAKEKELEKLQAGEINDYRESSLFREALERKFTFACDQAKRI